MQSTNALSLPPAVKDWLANSRYPHILHVFDQACNLINERGEVLSIVTPQIGNGPFNLVVAESICFLNHCHPESLISLSPAQFTVGNLIIHTTDVKLWQPRPDWERFHADKDKITHQITQLQITNYFDHIDFVTPFKAHLGLPTTQSLVSNLCSSLAIADFHFSRMAAQSLAGLGIGLTPSGDDFIMGALYAAWIIHPFETANILAKDIADTAAPRTTSLSAAWLRSAGRGEAGILWHQLLDALICEDHTAIKESTKNILAVGATSGADALAGFIDVFESWIEKAGPCHG